LKALRSADKRLSCRFEEALERFVITYQRPFGEPIPLTVVETEDKGFRWPEQRDIEFLQKWDMENMRLKDRLAMVTNYMERYQEQQRRRTRENHRDMTKDNKIQLMNAFGKLMGTGKHNATFRRVEPRKKNLGSTTFTVKDKRIVQAAAI
jgi:lysyl-tRNA synthetase class I